MMISSPSAGDPYAAAAALDKALRSNNGDGGDDALASASETTPIAADPDVVVTLSQGGSAPATYNASGRMSATPSLADMGANGPRSLVQASESVDGQDATAEVSPAPADSSADADADTAVAA